MNLFFATRRLTQAKEDHLTEFLASALELDEGFRRAYEETVLHPYASENGWDPVEIKKVTTQKSYHDARCRPDLVLTLADEHVIACEHKLDSPETSGQTSLEQEECDPVLQLERYLELPDIQGVAYFRSWWQAPDQGVLDHPRYITPLSGREHFLWSDLYDPILRGDSLVSYWLREAFERFGFTPAHPSIGELEHPNVEIRVQNRQNLKKLWGPTRTRLRSMGWSVESGSICQLYLKNNSNSNADFIYVSPHSPGGRVLLVRVTPRNSESAVNIFKAIQTTAAVLHLPLEVEHLDVSRVGGPRAVIDVKIPFDLLLGGATGVVEVENKLGDYICTVVGPIS